MNIRNAKYYISICILCPCVFLLTGCAPLYMLVYGDNYVGKIKLSKDEKVLQKKLSEDCKCSVAIKHNVFLIKGMKGNYKPPAGDSICNIVFEWDATKKDYDSTGNLYNKNQDYLNNYVNAFMPDLLKALSYQQYYKAVKVSFRTEHFYEYDSKVILGAHNKPMMDYDEKSVFYNLRQNRID